VVCARLRLWQSLQLSLLVRIVPLALKWFVTLLEAPAAHSTLIVTSLAMERCVQCARARIACAESVERCQAQRACGLSALVQPAGRRADRCGVHADDARGR
jgi:hypothetical protein